MPKIVPIVEGEGDLVAVPILLRKILGEMSREDIGVAKPKTANGCPNLLKPGGLETYVRHAWGEPDCGAVLVLLDADKNCPVKMAEAFAKRILHMGVFRSVVIVVAKCEYEAWFLASLETIAGRDIGGRPGLPVGLQYLEDVEGRVGAKKWLGRHFPSGRSYKETIDQAPMTHRIDTSLAKAHSRSFRRLCHAVEEALTAIDNGQVVVTPAPTR